jgi:hypothetical protein
MVPMATHFLSTNSHFLPFGGHAARGKTLGGGRDQEPRDLGSRREARLLLRSKRELAPTRPVFGNRESSPPAWVRARRCPIVPDVAEVHRRTPRERASERGNGPVRSGACVRLDRNSGVEPVPFRSVSREERRRRRRRRRRWRGARRVFRWVHDGRLRHAAARWVGGSERRFSGAGPDASECAPTNSHEYPPLGRSGWVVVRAWKTKKRYPQRHNDDALDGMGWALFSWKSSRLTPARHEPQQQQPRPQRPSRPADGRRTRGLFCYRAHRLGQCVPTCERTFPAMMDDRRECVSRTRTRALSPSRSNSFWR